jgi:hypothetical protein
MSTCTSLTGNRNGNDRKIVTTGAQPGEGREDGGLWERVGRLALSLILNLLYINIRVSMFIS